MAELAVWNDGAEFRMLVFGQVRGIDLTFVAIVELSEIANLTQIETEYGHGRL